ncbi:MAG: VWA domain-containing protein [Candidatus Contendobacter sp.]|nr:VWA domain-containing protein [Candidatus Contendobacter sp.]MDG4559577.1 VWA domain-containing protein [Candidatus Contendobacter sp.]
MKPKILLVTILPALVGVAAMWATHAADLYKWIDEKGQVHYTSAPPPETAKKPQQIDPANPGNPLSAPGNAPGAPGVLFILDASGSMKAKIGSQEKMTIAKEVMTNLLRDLPDTIQVGLEVYGHRAKGDCGDIELIAPVGRIDKAALIQRIQSIDPKGMTPITQALQIAAERLKTAEVETTVVLVSDGEETCKGDPCAAVGSLLQQGIKLKVHVVGFDVGDNEKQQLMCIAQAGKGKYFAANNAEQLKSALTEVKQEVVKRVEMPPPPTPVPEKKIVKIVKTERGEIRVPQLPFLGTIAVYEQQSGKKVGNIHGSQNNKSITVPAGTYKLEFGEYFLEGIEVTGDKAIEPPMGLIQAPKLPFLGAIAVYEQYSGKKVGDIHGSQNNKSIVVPAGTYKLRFDNQDIENLAVEAGQEVIIE